MPKCANRIEEQFVSYQMKVIPEGASEAQLRETQRAFYAGAVAMLDVLRAIGDRTTEQEGEDIFIDVYQELQLFVQRVQSRQQ